MANSFTYQDQLIHVGDKIIVKQKIQEDDKTRTQSFEGLVMSVSGRDINKSFTVRKIATNNIGVERIFPVSTPFIEAIEIKAKGKVRRANLAYLRGRTGRLALRVKEAKN